MPRTPVTRDPADPAFPHGTLTGFGRGCKADDTCPASPTCRDERRRAERRGEYLRAQGLRRRGQATDERRKQALAHLASLVEQVPGATTSSCLIAAGLSSSTTTTGKIGDHSIRRMLALTPEVVQAAVQTVPIERTAFLVHCLQAQGYSLRWIEQHSDAGTGTLTRLATARSSARRQQRYVQRKVADAVERIAARLAHVPATTDHGLSQAAISLARKHAADNGWWPLAAYREDGALDLRRLPGHPWAEADDDCGRLLDALSDLLRAVQPNLDTIAERHGVVRRRLERCMARYGLGVDYDRHYRTLRVDQPDALQRLRAVCDLADTDDVDRTLLALREGLVRIGAHLSRQEVPPDHPAAVAHVVEKAQQQAEAKRARERKKTAERKALPSGAKRKQVRPPEAEEKRRKQARDLSAAERTARNRPRIVAALALRARRDAGDVMTDEERDELRWLARQAEHPTDLRVTPRRNEQPSSTIQSPPSPTTPRRTAAA